MKNLLKATSVAIQLTAIDNTGTWTVRRKIVLMLVTGFAFM